MSDEEVKIHYLKEQFNAARRQKKQMLDFLARHYPEAYTDIHNHLLLKEEERAIVQMKKLGAYIRRE